MDSKRLRKAYNSLANGDEINLRNLYGVGVATDVLLHERAIEITKEDYQTLFALNEIDDRFFASLPDAIWDLDMALMNEYIRLCEMFEQIKED